MLSLISTLTGKGHGKWKPPVVKIILNSPTPCPPTGAYPWVPIGLPEICLQCMWLTRHGGGSGTDAVGIDIPPSPALMLGHVRDPLFQVICWCYVAVLFIQNGGEMETSEYGVLC